MPPTEPDITADDARGPVLGRSVAQRKAVDYRSGHFTGLFPSVKNGRQIQYESLLERDYIALIEADMSICWYDEQHPFEWEDATGRRRSSHFDFRVGLSEERIELSLIYLVEVKPLSKVIKYGLGEVYGHARSAAKRAGYLGLQLWTEREIRALPRLSNSAMVAAASRQFYSPTDNYLLDEMSRVNKFLADRDRFTIREFRAAFNDRNQGFRTAIRMIAAGELRYLDPSAPLDDSAVLVTSNSRE